MIFRPPADRRVSLALQGGGAHGAFTWGVLDALLEDGRVEFDGISGTSAGAMNAVVFADGMVRGGREGAREALAKFWDAVGNAVPFDLSMGGDAENGGLAPGIRMMLYWARQFSPQQLNPFDINPLRDIISAQIDFERLREKSALKLFIAATNANTGRLRLFTTREMSVQALLASGCLPSIHHTIEIDGEPYWDGAYSANPAVFPLLYDCAASNIMLVLLSPMLHGATPRTAEEIRARSLDLAFSTNFLREMRSIAHAREYASRSVLPLGRLERRLKRVHFHLVEADELLSQLAAETRLTTSLAFLHMLRDQGRDHAAAWLSRHYTKLGKRSSLNVRDAFY
ncbi:MAG: patatin-like phospholipase family protein [Thauera phenolivorans]|uniref:Patatin-like phospholipase family protein n=1 Tax=Thauera phenolivorans TaxID=1792543 RepID=A0A7X7LWK0_9RHOO|nr:patatin-like phospholipase family protein [Thauera phenolivorans]NLF54395.1 patatin-like phospholipase family protein [Thauera phenolivorans]